MGTQYQSNDDITLITPHDVVNFVFNVESTLVWRRRNLVAHQRLFNKHIIDSIDAFHCMTVAFLPIICENMSKLALPVLLCDAMHKRLYPIPKEPLQPGC